MLHTERLPPTPAERLPPTPAEHERLARALGFGCVAARENPDWMAGLAEHAQAYARAVAAGVDPAKAGAFAPLDRPPPADPALEAARRFAAERFAPGVALALAHPSMEQPEPIKTLSAFTLAHHRALGFRCSADAFAAIVPRAGRLTLSAWSAETLRVRGFTFEARAAAFSLMPYGAHIEVETPDGSPLPFTETGYQSLFVPFGELAAWSSVTAFVQSLFPVDEAEAAGQLGLFG